MGSSKKKRSHRDDIDHDPLDPPPKPKLPTIKLSLRLPGHTPTSQHVPSSSSSLSAPPSTSSSTTRKRRAPQHEDSEGEEDDLDIGSPRSSGGHHYHHNHNPYVDEDVEADPSSSHKKKKKHKHKHKHKHGKHKHSNHDRMEADTNDVDPLEGQQPTEHEADEADEDDRGSSELKTPKLKIRLGNQHHHHQQQDRPHHDKKHSRESTAITPSSASSDQITSKREHSRSRSLSTTHPTTLVHVKQEEEPSAMTSYQYAANLATSEEGALRPVYGQKKPFATIAHSGPEDEDDMLGGDLDDVEEEEEEDHNIEEGGNLASDNNDEEEEDEDEDDETLMSPTSDRSRAGSRSLGGSGVGTPTATTAGKTTKTAAQTKGSAVKGADGDSGSATATTTTTASKSSRGGKRTKTSSKRQNTPKLHSPAPPKRKNIAQICHKLLDGLFRKDHYSLFSAPVDVQQVPDYAHIIKHPMDLSTMRSKVNRGFYPKLDLFLEDFKLICDNCKVYNAPDTLYYKQAQKLWEWGSKVIEKERKAVQDIEEELAKLHIPVKEEETLDVDGLGDSQQQHPHSYQLPMQQSHQQHYQHQAPYPSQHHTYSRNPIMSFDEPLDPPTPMATEFNTSIRTPQQYRRSKRVKYKRDGTIQLSYSTDGSIDPNSHPDPWSLVPLGREYGAAPMVTPIYDFRNGHAGGGGMNRSAAPSSSSSFMSPSSSTFSSGVTSMHGTFQSYLDDYPYFRMPEVEYMPASFLDYGMYPMAVGAGDAGGGGTGAGGAGEGMRASASSSGPTRTTTTMMGMATARAGAATNIPAYTGMIFGDETGEAYVRSLASFLEGIVDPQEMAALPADEQQGLQEVKQMVVERVARLTHGSSLIAEQVAQVLRKKKKQQQQMESEGKTAEGESGDRSASVSMEVDDAQVDHAIKKEEEQEEQDEKQQGDGDKIDKEKKRPVEDDTMLLDLRPYSFGSLDNTGNTGQPQDADEIKKEVEKEGVQGGETIENKSRAGLINVERLIHDLELWPDFDAWRRFKIELECLVPPSSSSPPSKAGGEGADEDKSKKEGQDKAISTAADTEKEPKKEEEIDADDSKQPDKEAAEIKEQTEEAKEEDIKVLWGLSWPAVNDPEEAERKKKWVGEYLEQNAADMREVLRVLDQHHQRQQRQARATAGATTSVPEPPKQTEASTTTATSTAATPSSTTSSSAKASWKDLQENERAAVEKAVVSIRRRLIKMAQYVPLSQVNPDKLPPPPPPTTTTTLSSAGSAAKAAAPPPPAAASSTSASTSASASPATSTATPTKS